MQTNNDLRVRKATLNDAKEVGWLAFECYFYEVPPKFLNDILVKNIFSQAALFLLSMTYGCMVREDASFFNILVVYLMANLMLYLSVRIFFGIRIYLKLKMHTSEKEFFEDLLPSSDGKLSTFWVVETTVDNKIVACGGYSTAVTPIFDDIIRKESLVYPVELKKMLVKKDFRRRGLAKKLLKISLEELVNSENDTILNQKQDHCKQVDVFLWSTVYNTAALNFYYHYEFEEIFRMRNIIVPAFPFDIIAMRRTLLIK